MTHPMKYYKVKIKPRKGTGRPGSREAGETGGEPGSRRAEVPEQTDR
jgi:hypothetical protein